MTSEEMERAIEFLIQHHAKFSAEMVELADKVTRMANTVDQLTEDAVMFRESILNLKDVVLSLANIVEQQGDQIAQNSQQIATLSEHGKDMDARLDVLIKIVEGHITNPDAHKQ